MGKSPFKFFSVDSSSELKLPFVGTVSAGFPSPANDYLDNSIDLNKELIKNPSSTFLVRVSGHSMKDAGINDKDLLVIDKSLEPASGRIAICMVNGEFTLKRLKVIKKEVYLMPENPEFKPLKITPESDFAVWGIVSFIIKSV